MFIMCGIAGFLYNDYNRRADSDTLRRMTDTLVHRGPDGEGLWCSDNIALGHRRLSIIDLDGGKQPMQSDDGTLTITFNGEIYNYLELKAELTSLGHTFRTNSDTEVILNSYRQWGESCVHKFNGMWAFALWDSTKQMLFCSRDRIGEKPFYYAQTDEGFVFASEIKALFGFGIPRVINNDLLDAYLSLTYIPAPYTFFKNIFKLKPGNNIIARTNGISITQYWDIPTPTLSEQRNDEENILEEFSYLFRDAVALRMRADVPFGAFLSGGLDSASVVATMSGLSKFPIKTFTTGFNEKEYDERSLAKLVADSYSTHHTELLVTDDDISTAIEKLSWYYDEPFGDSSALPTYIVSKLAREHVTMVLTGDGGDEVLSGYTIHQGEKFAHQLRYVPDFVLSGISNGLMNTSASISSKKISSLLHRAGSVINSSSQSVEDRIISKQNGFGVKDRKNLRDFAETTITAEDIVSDTLTKVSNADNFTKLNYWLSKVSLPDDMLTKVDRATMAHSLEARVPFLDHRIIELGAMTSMNVKLRGYTRKHILRKTIAKQLPKELLLAKKMGFVVPISPWMSKNTGRILNHHIQRAESAGLIRSEATQRILQFSNSPNSIKANSVWTLAMLSKSVLG
jgi:asparagine synthase (glutamine-hydrolysing)